MQSPQAPSIDIGGSLPNPHWELEKLIRGRDNLINPNLEPWSSENIWTGRRPRQNAPVPGGGSPKAPPSGPTPTPAPGATPLPPPNQWQPGDPLPPSVMPAQPGYFRPDPNEPLRPNFGEGGINPNPIGVGRRPAPTSIVGRQPQRPAFGALGGLIG